MSPSHDIDDVKSGGGNGRPRRVDDNLVPFTCVARCCGQALPSDPPTALNLVQCSMSRFPFKQTMTQMFAIQKDINFNVAGYHSHPEPLPLTGTGTVQPQIKAEPKGCWVRGDDQFYHPILLRNKKDHKLVWKN